MRRRGPPKATAVGASRESYASSENHKRTPQEVIIQGMPDWPFQLDRTESQLLDHYIRRFCRVYPIFAGPTTPFLQIIIPLCMQSCVVLDAALALSGV